MNSGEMQDKFINDLNDGVVNFLEKPSSESVFKLIVLANENKGKVDDASFIGGGDRSAAFFQAANKIVFEGDVVGAKDVFFQNSKGVLDDDDIVLWFYLLVRCRVLSKDTYESFEEILDRGLDVSDKAAKEMIRLKWSFEGADSQLLEYINKLRERLNVRSVIREYVALCLFLGREDIVLREIKGSKWLRNDCHRLIPLATFLYEKKIDCDRDVAYYHKLHRAILDNSSSLENVIRTKSLAVVGNSPCEAGKGKGEIIDSFSKVARFNFFSIDDKFSADYGAKFNIHVRGPRDDGSLAERSEMAEHVVLNQYDFLYHYRNWEHIAKMHDMGVRFCCLPKGHHCSLQKELKAQPSLGLSFLKYVKDVSGVVKPEQCFGFSFTDQLSGRAHYFDDNHPAYTHNWKAEREIYERLVNEQSVPYSKKGFWYKLFGM